MMTELGRAEDVFCNGWKPRWNHLRHEVLLTDFLLCYPEAQLVRGWKVNKRIRPDAEMVLNGDLMYVEMDTGVEDYNQIRQRQKSYAGVREFLLYVTLSRSRVEGLIRHSEAVQGIALFTTLEQVLAEPHGEIWRDCGGQRGAI